MRKRLLAIIATAALVVTMIPSMVFGEVNVDLNDPDAMQKAVTAASTTETTIKISGDYTGNGVVVNSGQNITFDLNGYEWDITGLVGSAGTETNGMQLLKNSKVTIKNGTITSKTAKLLIQNYSDLTLENVTLDGSKLKGNPSYTLSNNAGSAKIGEYTVIIPAESNGFALDVYYYVSGGYPVGPKVTIEDGAYIVGDIECAGYNGTVPSGGEAPKLTISKNAEVWGAIYAEGANEDVIDKSSAGSAAYVKFAELDNNDNLIGEVLISYDGSEYTPDEIAVLENATFVDRGQIAKDPSDDLYYMYEPLGKQLERIAYDINFYMFDQNGNAKPDEDGWSGYHYACVGKNKTIQSALDADKAYSGYEYKDPTLDGYKFAGWYTATVLEEDNDGEPLKVKLEKKVNLTDVPNDDMELFPKGEKVTAVPEKSPNTGDNTVAPFAVAGLVLAAMAAVAATRRRTN